MVRPILHRASVEDAMMPISARVVKKSARTLLVVLLWYLAAYVLMMDWRRVAYDPIARVPVNQSAYRFAPIGGGRVPGPFTVYEAFDCVSWANRVFWPVDVLVRGALMNVDDRVRNLALTRRTAQPTISMATAEAPPK